MKIHFESFVLSAHGLAYGKKFRKLLPPLWDTLIPSLYLCFE